MMNLLPSVMNRTLKLPIAYRTSVVFSMKGNSNRLSEMCRDEEQFLLARKDDLCALYSCASLHFEIINASI